MVQFVFSEANDVVDEVLTNPEKYVEVVSQYHSLAYPAKAEAPPPPPLPPLTDWPVGKIDTTCYEYIRYRTITADSAT